MINFEKNTIPKTCSRLASRVLRLFSPLTSCVSCLTSLFSVLCSLAFAQGPPPPGQFGEIDTLSLRDTIPFDAPDTSAVKFFYANDFTPQRIVDTLEKVRFYDPVFNQKYGYYSLGDLGSAHQQSVYQPREREGIDLGFHHYDLHLKKAHDLRFFNTSHPYSQFAYSAGATQEEGFINAIFTQNLTPNFNASVDYSRIVHRGAYESQRVRHTNLGISAWYRTPNDRYYGLLTWAGNSIKQQNNGGIQGDSLLTDSNFDGSRDLIPVRLNETAQTEYDHDEFVYTQYFNIFRKRNSRQSVSPPSAVGDSLFVTRDSLFVTRDSLFVIRDSLSRDSLFVTRDSLSVIRDSLSRDSLFVTRDSLFVIRDSLSRDSLSVSRDSLSLLARDSSAVRPPPSAVNRPLPLVGLDSSAVRRLSSTVHGLPSLGTGFSHCFRYKRERLKSFDADPTPSSDADFYGIFRTNERGLRHFVNVRKFENRFGAFLFLGKNDEFRFEPALTHAFVVLDQEPQDSTMQELRVSANLETSIANVFDLDAYAHYELGANFGDYLLKGSARLKLGKLGQFEGQILQHQYAPNLIQYRLFISQEAVWENDFKKTNETNFRVQYHLPTIKSRKKLEVDISGGLENHLLSNFIYYNTLAIPVQADGLKNVAQVFAEANIRFGKIYTENKIVVQQTSDEYLRLPRLWSQHSLYFQGFVFKSAALLRMGVDMRYQSNLKLDDWWALTGQFYRQNDQTFISQPITDVFLSFKVNRFRTFVKLGNAFQPLAFSTRLVAPDYPTRDMYFRFGLTWAFMD